MIYLSANTFSLSSRAEASVDHEGTCFMYIMIYKYVSITHFAVYQKTNFYILAKNKKVFTVFPSERQPSSSVNASVKQFQQNTNEHSWQVFLINSCLSKQG